MWGVAPVEVVAAKGAATTSQVASAAVMMEARVQRAVHGRTHKMPCVSCLQHHEQLELQKDVEMLSRRCCLRNGMPNQ